MTDILKLLKGGDFRSIGKSNEVVKLVKNDPSLFKVLIEAMQDEDPLIRMRSADGAEKVSKDMPHLLTDFKNKLIYKISKIDQQEIQWHLAQIYGYLNLSETEVEFVAELLFNWIENSESQIVKAFSLETLGKLAHKNIKLQEKLRKFIEKILPTASPAVKTKCKKILAA